MFDPEICDANQVNYIVDKQLDKPFVIPPINQSQQKQKNQIVPGDALAISQGPFMGAGIFRLREDLFEQRELSER